MSDQQEIKLPPVGDVLFAQHFDLMTNRISGINERSGFDAIIGNELYYPTKMALVVTEIAEGIEAHRRGDIPDDHLPQYRMFDCELADAVIRLMDIAAKRGVSLGQIIVDKVNYNAKREFRHGGKKY